MNIKIILCLLFLLVTMIGLFLKYRQTVLFKRKVNLLLRQSTAWKDEYFHYKQLEGLPSPVRKYFERTLIEGQQMISYARIRHNGNFKSGVHKSWKKINGEQYATTFKPGFIWKGSTFLFTALDMYIAGTGCMQVHLFNIFPVVNVSGGQYNQGELLRWLGESVLYPTNLLPGQYINWYPVDDHSARLSFDYNGLSLFYIVRFDPMGNIIQLETKRYMEKDKLATWIINCYDHQTSQNIRVPFRFEVLWRFAEGDLMYAKFNVQSVEYNVPELF